jgi:hypothetical protein
VVRLRIQSLPPDPIAIARALGGAARPGLAVLASRPRGAPRRADARFSFVACDPVEVSDDLVPPAPAPPHGSLGPGYGGAIAAPRWVGVVPYDALRALERPGWSRTPDERAASPFERPVWHRYAAVVRVDHASGDVAVEADDAASAANLARSLQRTAPPAGANSGEWALAPLPADEPEEAHRARVREALRLIAAGDLYEVNLARRIPFRFRGDVLAMFARLLEEAPAPWAFLMCSAIARCAPRARSSRFR